MEIIEDDIPLKNALSDKLRHEGFAILEAKNGKIGLEMALAEHPNLILLDLKMPIMDGITMLKILRGDPWGKNVPVIVLTNLDDSESMADTMGNDALYFFVKTNISLEEVIKKIKETLGIA